MIEERLEEQAALYALGALPTGEQAAFEAALRQDAELQKLVADLRSAAEGLAGTVPLVNPPPALRRKILAQIAPEEKIVPLPVQAATAKPLAWFPWALAACLAILCVVLAASQSRMHSQILELSQLAATLQNTTNDLQTTIATLREDNRLANIRVAMLGSLIADEPKVAGVSLWNEKTQEGEFIAQNLKTLPSDKDYQLWVIDQGVPVDAGLIFVKDLGKARIQFKPKSHIKTADKFAVTVEAKGGSPTPKGTMLMISD
jgi:anti-sigma-K factor RskA